VVRRARPQQTPRSAVRRDDGDWFKTDDWNNWRNRHFYEAFDALEIARRRAYDLRHSFVSLMIREGQLTIVELAEQAGACGDRDTQDLCPRIVRDAVEDGNGLGRREGEVVREHLGGLGGEKL
jgi:integrase